MTTAALTLSQQSSPRLPGTWKLPHGRAVTLAPREDGVLRVSHGRLWVTFDGPHGGALNEQGDQVLEAGQRLRVPARQRVVLEPVDRGVPAYFSWDFAVQAAPVRASRRQAVAQSWSELLHAAALGLRAAGALARALAELGVGLVAPRPRPAASCAA